MSACRVPLCVCEAGPSGLCAVHRQMPEALLLHALAKRAGLIGQLRPITTRIERDDDGLPVRFYPETRRGNA